MIRDFADKDLESLYHSGPSRATKRIPPDLYKAVFRRLTYLAEATQLTDLRVPPANRLEALKGNWAGWFSIRVNDQWRIVFHWEGNTAFNVRFLDYH